MWGWESPSLRKWFNPFMTSLKILCSSSSLYFYIFGTTALIISGFTETFSILDKQIRRLNSKKSEGLKLLQGPGPELAASACRERRRRRAGGCLWGSSETAEVISAVRRSWWLRCDGQITETTGQFLLPCHVLSWNISAVWIMTWRGTLNLSVIQALRSTIRNNNEN